MTSMGHFGASDDQTIYTRIYFWGNMAVEAIDAAEAAEVNEAAGVCKAWIITTESSRFLNLIIRGLISLAPFLSEAVEASLCYCWWNSFVCNRGDTVQYHDSLLSKELGQDETQMPKPQKYTDTFIITQKMFLVGLRGLQSLSIWAEAPHSVFLPDWTLKK